MKPILCLILPMIAFSGIVHARYLDVEAVITKVGDEYFVSHPSSDKPVSIEEFAAYLKNLKNNSVIGLSLLSAENVPIPMIKTILDGASQNPLIELLDIRLNYVGKSELERLETQKAEHDGTGRPATRSESKPKGSDKPQPEAEGRSR